MAIKNLYENNFDEEIRNSGQLLIVDFWASWCTPCRMLAPILEELSEEYEDKVKFAKVNTEEEPALASRFDIKSIPCLILFLDGKEINRVIGLTAKHVLKQKIDGILEKINKNP